MSTAAGRLERRLDTGLLSASKRSGSFAELASASARFAETSAPSAASSAASAARSSCSGVGERRGRRQTGRRSAAHRAPAPFNRTHTVLAPRAALRQLRLERRDLGLAHAKPRAQPRSLALELHRRLRGEAPEEVGDADALAADEVVVDERLEDVLDRLEDDAALGAELLDFLGVGGGRWREAAGWVVERSAGGGGPRAGGRRAVGARADLKEEDFLALVEDVEERGALLLEGHAPLGRHHGEGADAQIRPRREGTRGGRGASEVRDQA